jgi:hypothetical protein
VNKTKCTLLSDPYEQRIENLMDLYAPRILTTEMSDLFLKHVDITHEEKCWLRSHRHCLLDNVDKRTEAICNFMKIKFHPSSRPHDASSFINIVEIINGAEVMKLYELKTETLHISDKSRRKLNGTWCTSHFTWKTYSRNKENDIIHVIAGFYNYELIYIFTIHSEDLLEHMYKSLDESHPQKNITLHFGYNQYCDKPTFKIFWVNPLLQKYKKAIGGKMANDLRSFLENEENRI